MLRTEKFVFPTHLIPKGSRVVIYGYGDMGKDYEEYLYISQYAQIVAISDTNYELLSRLKYPVNSCTSSELVTLAFDFIIIASTNFHNDIRDYLVKLGISNNKIIYTEITEPIRSNNQIANITIDYFIQSIRRNEQIYADLMNSMDNYIQSNLLSLPNKTLELQKMFRWFDSAAFTLHPYEDERFFYGHISNIAHYGNILIDYNHFERLPSCIHGTTLFKIPYRYNKTPLIFCCNDIPGLANPNIVLGPYIAYSNIDIEDELKSRYKDKLGNTLTIFYPHTSFFTKHSHTNCGFLEEAVIHKRLAYDSILCCVYFSDITAELLEFCSSLNIIPVTAGVRTDPRFINRVRTILDLTDDTVFFDYWGDSMSYALFLGKNIIYYDIGLQYGIDLYKDNNCSKSSEYKYAMKSTLKSGEFISETAKQYISKSFCHDKVRTPEEIKALFEINDTIYTRAYGDRMAFRKICSEYVSELAKNYNIESKLKYRLLTEAIDNIKED